MALTVNSEVADETIAAMAIAKELDYYNFINLIFVTMKKNMGTVDRVIRVLVAVIVLVLYFTHVISGTLAVILLILAGIFVVTSLLGLCPLYLPFGLSTTKKE